VDPLPVDERSPLLHRHSNGEACEEQDNEELEAQARQERREHDVGSVPVADEPSTRRLLVTMGSMWLGTFFAALGMCDWKLSGRAAIFVKLFDWLTWVPFSTRLYDRSDAFWTD
jgi:hypothetical protein